MFQAKALRQALEALDEGPSFETSSFYLFFSGSNITTQHSNFTLVLVQTVLVYVNKCTPYIHQSVCTPDLSTLYISVGVVPYFIILLCG